VGDGRLVLDLVAGLASAGAHRRQRTADEVTDVHRHLGDDDTSVLATVLVAARLVEGDKAAQEAQLHALAELAEWHQLPRTVVARLHQLPRPTGDPSQDDYLAFLLHPSPR